MNSELLSAIENTAYSLFCARRFDDDGATRAYKNLLFSLEQKYFADDDASRDLLRHALQTALRKAEKKFVPKPVLR